MAERVFFDTSALIALGNSDDAHHRAAIKVAKELEASRAALVTSQWVLTELLGGGPLAGCGEFALWPLSIG